VRPDCHTSAALLLLLLVLLVVLLLLLYMRPLLLLLLLAAAAVLLLLLLLLLLRHSRQHCPAERVQVSTAAGQLDSKHTALGSELNAQLNKRHPAKLHSSSSSSSRSHSPACSTTNISSRRYKGLLCIKPKCCLLVAE
jgi:ABC-type nickel/cobalt efflux system permease component RcnA